MVWCANDLRLTVLIGLYEVTPPKVRNTELVLFLTGVCHSCKVFLQFAQSDIHVFMQTAWLHCLTQIFDNSKLSYVNFVELWHAKLLSVRLAILFLWRVCITWGIFRSYVRQETELNQHSSMKGLHLHYWRRQKWHHFLVTTDKLMKTKVTKEMPTQLGHISWHCLRIIPLSSSVLWLRRDLWPKTHMTAPARRLNWFKAFNSL